jgi:hypothetical protein
MKEVDALAKNLRLMLALDAKPLARVHSPEAFLEPRNNFLLRQNLWLWQPVFLILADRESYAADCSGRGMIAERFLCRAC